MSNMNYLVIDDDKRFGEKLVESFQKRGLKAFHAPDIESGVKIIKAKKIDRVVLDLKLDHQNGLVFLEKLPELPKIEVVVLTGFGSVSTVTLALKNGAINYLQKPSTVDQIIESFNSAKQEIINQDLPTLENMERDHINRVLIDQKGNISKSAQVLGLHRRSLQRKLKSFE